MAVAALAVAALVAVAALAVGGVAASAVQPTARPGAATPMVGGCHVFPAENYWNADISRLPVAPRSRQWIRHMSPATHLHPDFGPSYGAQSVPYGIPITVVGARHPRVHVRFTYAAESDHLRYPLGRDTRIEGGRGSSGDRHAVIVDSSRCRVYETYATRVRAGRWSAGSGASWSMASDRLRPHGWTSADAAGLPILPGLLRFREVEVTHRVMHAIRFTTDVTDRRHIWPARHDAGSVSNHAYPPMGARFRLRAGFPIGRYRPDTRVVLRAMKRYGLVLADNGSPWFFQGAADRRWPIQLLDQLKTIPARAFVAVDTRRLEISPNSAAVRSR
ncbi:MAG: hypothetical protein ACRDP1_08650 [Nocardioidaceae bacterium]